MNLQEAIQLLGDPPVGHTTFIEAVLRGDTSPLPKKVESPTVEEVGKRLAAVNEAQWTCQSDWAYWAYEGERAYLSALLDILKAFEMVTEVPTPKCRLLSGRPSVVMDHCAHMQEFGRLVLEAAQAGGAA